MIANVHFLTHSSLPHGSDAKLFLVQHPNGAIPTAAQDAPLALTTTTRSSRSLTAAATPSYPVSGHRETHSGKMSGGFGSLLRSSASLDVTLAARKRPAPTRPKKNPAKISPAGLLGAPARSNTPAVHRWRDSDESSGEEHDDDDLEEEDSGSSLSGESVMGWIFYF